MTIKNILFDLDGTLTDPWEGITRCIQHALEKMDYPVPDKKELIWCIGPPLLESFKKLLGTDNQDMAMKALYLYRERFGSVGKFENRVYPDIPAILNQLNNQGFNLFLATSKPLVFSREIMDYFEISSSFKELYGSRLNGELCDKTELINHIMKKEQLEKNETIMVGDRKHDMIGAKNNHITAMGVTYGYGSRQELAGAMADHIVESPKELSDALSRQA